MSPPISPSAATAGILISLDGIDGTGKSTQCRMLVDWLHGAGHATTACVDPGGTPVGAVIRQLVLDKHKTMSVACEMFLFMASRAQLVTDVILPALLRGEVVVSDRFLLANVVYQGHAGGLNPHELWEIGKVATGGLEPNLTLVLDLPVEQALARKQGPADRLESRNVAYHQRVRRGFLIEAKRRPQKIRVIDASQPVEHVHAAIVEEVQRVLAPHPRA